MKNLVLVAVLLICGCTTIKNAGKSAFIWTHDSIDEWLADQTNVNTAVEGPLATNTTSTTTTPSEPQAAGNWVKPERVTVDWTARTIAPVNMPAGDIGEMLLIGRGSDGRAMALDYPAWDSGAGLWRTTMPAPYAGQDVMAELHAGSRTNAVIFKQKL